MHDDELPNEEDVRAMDLDSPEYLAERARSPVKDERVELLLRRASATRELAIRAANRLQRILSLQGEGFTSLLAESLPTDTDDMLAIADVTEISPTILERIAVGLARAADLDAGELVRIARAMRLDEAMVQTLLQREGLGGDSGNDVPLRFPVA